MSDIPNRFALDPEEWERRVLELRGNLQSEVVAILDDHRTPEAAAEALQSLYRPYLEEEEPSSASQLWAEVEEGRLRAGDVHTNAIELVYDESAGHWGSPHVDTSGETEAASAHERLADEVLETVWWGDADIRRRTIAEMEDDRELVADYLAPLHELAGEADGAPTAAQCREPLISLIEKFTVRIEQAGGEFLRRVSARVTDRSETDGLTHLTVGTGDLDAGEVLAVPPGESHAVDRLAERADLAPSRVLFATDHRRFDFSSQLPDDHAEVRLLDLSGRDERTEEFYRAVRDLRARVGSVLTAVVEG